MSDQPGSKYYLQKLNPDIFGLVNNGSNLSIVYHFNETVGPKNTDHTLSFLGYYVSTLPTWIRRIYLFLENTSSTNNTMA